MVQSVLHKMHRVVLVIIFCKFSYSLPLQSHQIPSPLSPSSLVLSSAACLFLGGDACKANLIPIHPSHQINSNAKFGNGQGLILPSILKPIFGEQSLDTFSGTNVDISQGRLSSGKAVDYLGLFMSQQGVRDAGVRGNGNFGGTWGKLNSVLGDTIGYGNVNDVNFNMEQFRMDSDRKAGLRGLYEETYHTVVDPFNLNFDQKKETCFGRILFGGKGVCRQENVGLAQPNANNANVFFRRKR